VSGVRIHDGGVNWSGNWQYYDFEQFPYTPSSMNTRVYGSYDRYPAGSEASIPFYFPFEARFEGAYFAGTGESPVSFLLYRAGFLVGESAELTPSGVPAFLSSGYNGLVDQVEVHVGGAGAGYFVMDDVSYEVTAVPEPSAFVLAALGFAAGVARLASRHIFRGRSRRAGSVVADVSFATGEQA
jgi:PEP-CTERM motif